MTISECINRFASRKSNPRENGTVTWKGGNVFSLDRVLYSYGTHFPLAVFLGHRDGKAVYILNGDKYSNSTSSHQSETRTYCNRGERTAYTTSFTALRAAGIHGTDLTLDGIVAASDDVRIDLVRVKLTEDTFGPWTYPNGAPFAMAGRTGEIRATGYDELKGGFHAPGAMLLRRHDRTFLATSDEGTYCIMELEEHAEGLNDAFESLKPYAVRDAERDGLDVQRQGEWYFVPCDPPAGRSHAKQIELPRRDDRGNLHVVRAIVNGSIYCTGNVFHRNPNTGRATGQHRTLKLDGWFTAHRNTELASWSANGKVD